MFKIAGIFAVILTLALTTAKWLGYAAIGTLQLSWFAVFTPLILFAAVYAAYLLVVLVIVTLGWFFLGRS